MDEDGPQKEKNWTLQKLNHKKFACGQWEHGGICNLYDVSYIQEKHMDKNELGVYLNYRDANRANKYNQRF